MHKFVPTITTILDYSIILNDDRTILLLVEVNTKACFRLCNRLKLLTSVSYGYTTYPPRTVNDLRQRSVEANSAFKGIFVVTVSFSEKHGSIRTVATA